MSSLRRRHSLNSRRGSKRGSFLHRGFSSLSSLFDGNNATRTERHSWQHSFSTGDVGAADLDRSGAGAGADDSDDSDELELGPIVLSSMNLKRSINKQFFGGWSWKSRFFTLYEHPPIIRTHEDMWSPEPLRTVDLRTATSIRMERADDDTARTCVCLTGDFDEGDGDVEHLMFDAGALNSEWFKKVSEICSAVAPGFQVGTTKAEDVRVYHPQLGAGIIVKKTDDVKEVLFSDGKTRTFRQAEWDNLRPLVAKNRPASSASPLGPPPSSSLPPPPPPPPPPPAPPPPSVSSSSSHRAIQQRKLAAVLALMPKAQLVAQRCHERRNRERGIGQQGKS